MNAEALLALIAELYTQVRSLSEQTQRLERERDTYRAMAEVVAPDEFKVES